MLIPERIVHCATALWWVSYKLQDFEQMYSRKLILRQLRNFTKIGSLVKGMKEKGFFKHLLLEVLLMDSGKDRNK